MKTKQWIGAAAALLLLSAACVNNRGLVERPAFIFRNTSALEIDKVELSDTATVLYINAFYSPHSWIKIDPNSFLTDNKGKQYPVRSTEGIVLGKEFYMPDSGESEFTMTFSPVASNATFIDFSEGDFEGAFKIFGIQLTDKPLKTHLPKGFGEVAIDRNAVLPPAEFQSGKARLEGQILDYRSGMPAKVSVRVAYPFEYPPVEITLPVDEKGKFSGEIDAFSVHSASVRWVGEAVRCYIASGETTSLVLNPAEIGRRESRLLDKSQSSGKPVYYSGYLASLSGELADVRSVFSLDSRNDYDTFISFLQSIGNQTPETLKTFFLNEYQAKKAVLDTLSASPACKQILRCATDLSYASDIANVTSWLDRAYIYNNRLQSDRQGIEKYYATRKFDLPDDFYDVLKDFSLLNDPVILYVPETAEYVRGWQLNNIQPVLSRALGTDQGPLFDLMKVFGLYNGIGDFKPVDEAQIEGLPVDYREFIRKKNNELLELIETNRHKTGFVVNDVEKVPDIDVFPSILSRFKGKPVLIDFWATWCGPCRKANEELKPVKAELAGTDIVYVFIAGPNSPMETWKNMIPDLHGEHFRLTDRQWNYVGQKFNLRAVPTYFFIDRTGNIREKLEGYPGIQTMKEKIHQIVDK
ncbi:MAG: TlpA family protein disulfide reductase [Dysgonamonadaceae bacterium]|jgi:thiol-disulfide isomerase/thioredoxin|nr:TlpA family protein disulfide reductase [Dysgonamonadaceae bacterium]